jgi:hypothetical protein
MPSAAAVRLHIESALAQRIPSALTPAVKTIRPVARTGIETLDELLQGGLPVGAITELVGPECSGRTSVALSFLARLMHSAKVCAWIDVSDTLHPESAAAAGVDLSRLLWVRCGTPSTKPKPPSTKPWPRLEQALRVTGLLLQTGGFAAIVLDMGSIPPEFAARVPLATWFRYRAAAERSQTSVLLLSQYACAKSSAELALRLELEDALQNETTVFTGVAYRIEVLRDRFKPNAGNVIPLRKPPQSAHTAAWHSRTAWAGQR